MEEGSNPLYVCRAGEFDGFPPRAVAPAAAMFVFFGGVLRVVNQEVGLVGGGPQDGVLGGVPMFVIAGIDDGRVAEIRCGSRLRRWDDAEGRGG